MGCTITYVKVRNKIFLNYFSKIHFCSYFKTLSIDYLNMMMYFPLLLRNPLD